MFEQIMAFLPMIFFVNKIDWSDSQNLLTLRILFGVVQGVIVLLSALIYFKIKSSNDKRIIEIPALKANGLPDPSKPKEKITVLEYDIGQLKKYLQGIGTSTLISLFIHFQFGIAPPLFIQSFTNPFHFWNSNVLFKIYILGEDTNKYPRPLPEDGNAMKKLFDNFFGGQQQQQQEEKNNDDKDKLLIKAKVTEIEDKVTEIKIEKEQLNNIEEKEEQQPDKEKKKKKRKQTPKIQ